jgi:hypothetical protein
VLGLEKAGAIPISEATFGKSGQTHGMIDAESKNDRAILVHFCLLSVHSKSANTIVSMP